MIRALSPLASILVTILVLGTASGRLGAAEIVTWSGQQLSGERLRFGDGGWRLDDHRISADEVALAIRDLAPARAGSPGERAVTRDGATYPGRLLAERKLATVSIQRADAVLQVPRGRLAALILQPLEDGAVVEARPEGEHVVLRDGRVVAGTVEWMTVIQIGISAATGDLRLPRSSVHRIDLAAAASPPPKEGVTLRGRAGEVVHGRLERLDDQTAVVASVDGQVRIEAEQVVGIWARDERARPLNSLDAPAITTTPYLEVVHEPAFGRGLFGGELAIAGLPCDDGIAVHSRSALRYQLPAGAQRFVVVVGMDRSRTDRGVAEFRIEVGGQEQWAQTLRGSDRPRLVVVGLEGARQLELICDFAAHGSGGDHGVWAWPTVLR